MPTKSVIVAIFATALLFGVVVSGCNRNRDNSLASAKSRRRPVQEQDLSSARNIRPAEVLSASAYRPPVRRKRNPPARPEYNNNNYDYNQSGYARRDSFVPAPDPSSFQMARAYEPLPEPVPVSSRVYTADQPYNNGRPYYMPAAYQPQQQVVTQDYYVPAPTVVAAPARDPRYGDLPEYAYKPRNRQERQPRQTEAYVPPMRPQSPDLAMAQARLEPQPAYQQPQQAYVPVAMPVQQTAPRYNYNMNTPVPPVEPQQFSAPIPELEPVRYQRVAAAQPQQRAPRQVPQLQTMHPNGGPQFRQLEPVGAFGGGNAMASAAMEPMPVIQDSSSRDWVSSTATSMMYW